MISKFTKSLRNKKVCRRWRLGRSDQGWTLIDEPAGKHDTKHVTAITWIIYTRTNHIPDQSWNCRNLDEFKVFSFAINIPSMSYHLRSTRLSHSREEKSQEALTCVKTINKININTKIPFLMAPPVEIHTAWGEWSFHLKETSQLSASVDDSNYHSRRKQFNSEKLFHSPIAGSATKEDSDSSEWNTRSKQC